MRVQPVSDQVGQELPGADRKIIMIDHPHDDRARRLMAVLQEPPFTNIVDFCGSEDQPGIDAPVEWRIWVGRPTTEDQARIEQCLAEMVDCWSTLLHVGVGNSSLARRFCPTVASIHGLTIHPEEREFAERLNIQNYAVSLTNKYSSEMTRIGRGFDFVIDNNPSLYACCLFHFCRMMVTYAEALRNGGAILTAEPGLSWVMPGADPAWSLSWKDWVRLGNELSMSTRQITPMVYAMERRSLGQGH
jgi:hypothetical protein